MYTISSYPTLGLCTDCSLLLDLPVAVLLTDLVSAKMSTPRRASPWPLCEMGLPQHPSLSATWYMILFSAEPLPLSEIILFVWLLIHLFSPATITSTRGGHLIASFSDVSLGSKIGIWKVLKWRKEIMVSGKGKGRRETRRVQWLAGSHKHLLSDCWVDSDS